MSSTETTLRDKFAIAAMQGDAANLTVENLSWRCAFYYKIADAMLAERNRQQPPCATDDIQAFIDGQQALGSDFEALWAANTDVLYEK